MSNTKFDDSIISVSAGDFEAQLNAAKHKYFHNKVGGILRRTNSELKSALSAFTTVANYPPTNSVTVKALNDETSEMLEFAAKTIRCYGYDVKVSEVADDDDGPGRYSLGYKYLEITVPKA